MSIAFVVLSHSSHAQFFKKKRDKDQESTTYAYQTFSTTLKKEKKSGYAGDEPKFHFEKPLAPVPFGKSNRSVDRTSTTFFGHKHAPKKRLPGRQKLCKVCGIKH